MKPGHVKKFDRNALKLAVERLHGIYTPYPRLDAIKAGIVDLIGRSNRSSQGDIQVLVGPTRAGKSHLLDDLMLDFKPEPNAIRHENGDFCDRVPVVISKVPDSTVKRVAEHIYRSISGRKVSEVLGKRYNKDDVQDEIVRLARECELKLLILDEAHQSIDQRTDKVAFEVAVLLKDLVNEALFSILVVGTENAMRLIQANKEVEGRTTVIYRIEPFDRSPDSRRVWLDILQDYDAELALNVFGKPSGLTAPDVAEALLNASLGIVGYMATLVEKAAIMAVDDMIAGAKDPGIEWRHLEAAFAAWAPGIGRVNPFSKAARPPAGGTEAGSDEPGEDEAEGPASGVRGRKRANRRDAELRK